MLVCLFIQDFRLFCYILNLSGGLHCFHQSKCSVLMIEKCLKESLMPNCYPFLCNSDFCNYISGLLSFISYFDKMSLKSGLNTKCLHSREQDHLIWKHDFWEETFFPVMKMSNFVFRTSSDNSLKLTKYGVNALAS